MKLVFDKLAKLSCLLALMLISVAGISQRTISGVVIDDSGEGVIGANVLVVGTSTGTITDFDGSYSIEVPEGATQIEFSYIGYTTQTIDIGESNVIDVTMAEGTLLDEVVVVGYGSVKSKEVTSAVASIGAKDFNRGNVNDAPSALQGKVAGLSIYNRGGDPNSAPTIRLRGISTVGANTEPLIVIDGVIGASLDNVDPSDIESMNVLKDGSAAAIYGSRGSSGVILVTTKRGKLGDGVRATYNGYVAGAQVARKVQVMTPDEYLAAGGNDLGGRTDWQDEVTQTGITQVHNVAVSGGTETTTFRLSANYRDVEGVLRKSGFDQINARANINHYAFNDKLNLSFNLALTNRNQNFSFPEALRYANLYNPTAPVRFDNGSYFEAILFDNFNPVSILEQNQNVGERRNLNFNGFASYELVEGLKLNLNYGEQYVVNNRGQFYPSTSFFRGLNRQGLARRESTEDRFRLFETYAEYKKDLNSSMDMTLTAGYSYQEEESTGFNVEVGNFPTNDLGFNILQTGANLINGNASGLEVASFASPTSKIIAFFGRAAFNFDDAISVNASLRREGSTRLGEDNQWGLFPAVGVAVDINKYANIQGFNALKLRAGYGVTGSLPGRNGLSRDGFEYGFGGGGTVTKVRAANPDLKWEEKAEINIGLDFTLLDYKLVGSLDFFNRSINDFILEREVETAIFGTNSRYENAGKLSTNGVELSLAYTGIGSGDFKYTPQIAVSTLRTTLDEFVLPQLGRGNLGAPGQNGTNVVRIAVGEELGQIWGPVFEGVSSEGAPIFADLNGDGTVKALPGQALEDDADFKTLGNGIPTLELGINNTFTYKNWDLNVFFRGAFGHSLVNTYRAFYEPIDPGAINSYNRVKTDLQDPNLTVAQFSSLYVEKADFLRLDNMTLGYNFNFNEGSAFRDLRAYMSVQNVFTLTSYQGIDPDVSWVDSGTVDNGGDAPDPDVLAPGIERRNSYFTPTTITFGISVGF